MTKENKRTGFMKISRDREWFVEDGILYWKEDRRKCVSISELRPIIFDEGGDQSLTISSVEMKNIIEWVRDPASKEEKYAFVWESKFFPDKKFLKIAKVLLASSEWSDAEKMIFLSRKLPYLDGFDYGAEINKLLFKMSWKNRSLKLRTTSLFDLIKEMEPGGSSLIDRVRVDAKRVDTFDDTVRLYRGFNVPNKQSIRRRGIEGWSKQDAGRSVYFTLDEGIATWFACTQKLRVIQDAHNGNLSRFGAEILNSRLVVAEYSVPVNDIILFGDYLTRAEMECVCLPLNVNLVNYKFLGFDDFIGTLKSGSPIQKRKNAFDLRSGLRTTG